MGKPLMLRDQDDARIELLKKRMGARTKIEVVRLALDLLQSDVERTERVERWRRAARLVSKESRQAVRDFQGHSRLRRID